MSEMRNTADLQTKLDQERMFFGFLAGTSVFIPVFLSIYFLLSFLGFLQGQSPEIDKEILEGWLSQIVPFPPSSWEKLWDHYPNIILPWLHLSFLFSTVVSHFRHFLSLQYFLRDRLRSYFCRPDTFPSRFFV